MFAAILSLLTGCGSRSPDKPGVSLPLRYPVLLIGERDVIVKADEAALVTTTGASGGVYHPAYQFVDSDGAVYEVVKATAIGKQPSWRDLGTSSFQVYLRLKARQKIPLKEAKARALAAAIRPGLEAIGEEGVEIAKAKIGGATSFAELIEACRSPWRRP